MGLLLKKNCSIYLELATAPVQKYSIAKPKLQNRKSASYSVAAFDILQSLDVNSLQKRTAQMGEINPNQNQSSIAGTYILKRNI